MKKRELRAFQVKELRVSKKDGEPTKIVGHAAVFDKLSLDLGGFRERIAAGAFAKSLGGDVRALWNHNTDFVLGRTTSKTLRLSEDAEGLAVAIDLPDTQWARDHVVTIERGDVTQMSFAFSTIQDAWNKVDGEWIRTLLEVELFDVSPVTFPAYPDTDVAARGLQAAQAAAVPTPPSEDLEARRRRLRLAEAELGQG